MKEIIAKRKTSHELRTKYIESLHEYYAAENEDEQALVIEKANALINEIDHAEIAEMDAIRAVELAKTVAEKKYTTLADAIKKILNEQ